MEDKKEIKSFNEHQEKLDISDVIVSDYSKQDVLCAIMTFAKLFKKDKAYTELIKITELPRLVEMIAYDMFLNNFNSYHTTDELYNKWKLILSYAKDIKKGYINFKS